MRRGAWGGEGAHSLQDLARCSALHGTQWLIESDPGLAQRSPLPAPLLSPPLTAGLCSEQTLWYLRHSIFRGTGFSKGPTSLSEKTKRRAMALLSSPVLSHSSLAAMAQYILTKPPWTAVR